jgi:hypothetical protein
MFGLRRGYHRLGAAAGLGGLLSLLCAGASVAAALPDWSGVWFPHERNLFDPSALPPAQRQVKDTASSLFEASYERMYPPYRPEYEARYEKTLKDTNEGRASDPTAGCVPPGFPRIMGTPYPLEFVVETGRVAILFEAYSQVRRIYTDGTQHPDDLDPSYNGHSIGHWEGDTLVVDTDHLESSTITNNGLDHSENVHVIERFRLSPDGRTLLSTQEFEDPQTLDNRGARFIAWKKQDGQFIEPYECDPSFALNYGK